MTLNPLLPPQPAPDVVAFDRHELGTILSLYGRMVAAGEFPSPSAPTGARRGAPRVGDGVVHLDVEGTVLSFESIAAVTALLAGALTILMGVVGRYPFALATGLGINAIVAVFAATQLSWPEIMGLVVLEGLLITVLVLTGFRRAVFEAIPAQLIIASLSEDAGLPVCNFRYRQTDTKLAVS